MRKHSSFTKTQFLVLLGLIIVVILVISLGVTYVLIEKNSAIVIASPASLLPTSTLNPSFANLPSTATLIPTFVYQPTWTPPPAPTSFVLTPAKRPTLVPQQSQSNVVPTNPSAGKSGPDCSAELDYAAAMHKYYLDSIDYIHAPMIDYYQNLISQATANRDALGIVQAQRGLAAEKAHVNAEKASENKRYKAERASLNANCQ